MALIYYILKTCLIEVLGFSSLQAIHLQTGGVTHYCRSRLQHMSACGDVMRCCKMLHSVLFLNENLLSFKMEIEEKKCIWI